MFCCVEFLIGIEIDFICLMFYFFSWWFDDYVIDDGVIF